MAPYVPILAALSASLAILSLFVGIYRLLKPAGELEGRLAESVNRVVLTPEEPLAKQLLTGLKGINFDRRLAGKMAMSLEQADLSLTVNEYVMMRVGGAVAGLILGALLFSNIAAGLILAVLALQVPVFIVGSRVRKRQQRFQAQLVDVITMLSSGLRAGVGLMQAMDLVRREMPQPSSDEFGRVVREVGLGASLSEALQHLVTRMPSDDLSMLVTVINIQAEVGGNLANILETVVTTIRERIQVAQEIRTLTASQRVTSYVLAGLPIIVGGALFVINPDYMGSLFEPQWVWMPIGAGVMIGIGFFIINRLVDIKV